MLRIDDLNREERYFSATILPYLLAYNNFSGLKVFLEFINLKFLSNSDLNINLNSFKDNISSLQLITEPYLERDLSYNKFPIPSESFERKGNKQSKPDLLIIYDNWALLFEAKLFSSFNEFSLEEQMKNQTYILDIVKNISENNISDFLQIAICPYDYSLKSFGLITWKEIYDILNKVIPENDYFLNRLKSAISRC